MKEQGRKPLKLHIKKEALHHQLGYPEAKHIPPGKLESIKEVNVGTHFYSGTPSEKHTVTPLLKRRVNFAINAATWRK